MTIAGGALVDAADLAGLAHDGTVDTAVGTIASGFTLTSAKVRTALDGALVTFVLDIVPTSAITATSGNITDTTCFTLDAEYAPAEAMMTAFSGQVIGGANLGADGVVQLRTASDTVASGNALRMQWTYLRA